MEKYKRLINTAKLVIKADEDYTKILIKLDKSMFKELQAILLKYGKIVSKELEKVNVEDEWGYTLQQVAKRFKKHLSNEKKIFK